MLKKLAVASVKLALIAALFYFLSVRALRGSAFAELRVDARSVLFLAAGCLFNLIATVITIVRWRALIQALDAPLKLVDALRYGFLGFAFNLSPLGVVGGDATKIVLVAKKTLISADAATASVVVDRFIGLYAMFALGLCVIFASGFYASPEPLARFTTQGLSALTLASTAFFICVVLPPSATRRREKIAGSVPFIGPLLQKATAATLLYRRRKSTLLKAFAATLVVHSLFAVSLYCFATALYRDVPSLLDHFVLYCSANVGSTIPLSAGPFEYFLDELYPLFNSDPTSAFSAGYGATIGVVYRLASVGVAALGVVYYLATRRRSQIAVKKR
ncbi:MAG: flippase-like domain-containing protein [Thermoguttaceae bacterium]|nr:flippase-like domain-containing protein [Thermoguttaceae bacterium]